MDKSSMFKMAMGAGVATTSAPAAGTFYGTLVRALSGQKELYAQILELTKQQSQYVTSGQTETLMGVLSARSRLLDQVAPLDKELKPYKGRWQEVLDMLPSDQRGVIAGLLKEVQQSLAGIIDQDEKDKAALVKQKEEVGSELQRTVSGTHLNRAYGMRPVTSGTVFN